MSDSFQDDWLRLREAADADARDRNLTQRARRWLADRRAPYRVVDLGAGGGNNPAWLAPRLPGPQRWRLVDHDAGLLATAAERLSGLADVDGGSVHLDTVRLDLVDVEAAVPADTDLVAASALFDLCPDAWFDRFAARCARVGCAALLTLTVDGRWRFVSRDGEAGETATDASMRERLNAHQRTDKGMGLAAGGDAPAVLIASFEAHGFAVRSAPSPWRLDRERHPELAVELLRGWRRALREQAPGAGDRIDAWWSLRRAALERGEIGLEVGHVDVWAEPRSE